MKYLLFLSLFLFFKLQSVAFTNVPVAVLEASYLPVYSNSERNTLIFSMPLALQMYGKKANECGYQYSFLFSEFAYGKPESAISATSDVLKIHPWFIWGPETNDELDQTKSFLDQASIIQISPFTFESGVNNKNIISLSSNESDEINALLDAVPKQSKSDYLSVIYDPSCKMCEIYFNALSKMNHKMKVNYYHNTSDITKIKTNILKDDAKNILLLLYGDTSGKLLENFNNRNDFLFLGTKMFGNEVSSELMSYHIENVNILTVRPLPPAEFNKINFSIIDGKDAHRVFDNTFYMIYFIEKITDLICKTKPKTEDDFKNIVLKNMAFFKYHPKFAILKFRNKTLYVDQIIQK
jgi:hypothetical protein